ncbi:MAG: Gfo/Idh/MocA family oxidoreductase [Tepidisphaeraceae bacterium]
MLHPDLSRRRFLQTSGAGVLAGAAGMALAPHVLGQAAVQKKVGFAIVGLGRFGAGQLLRSLPECKFAWPAALVSGDPAKAKTLAAKYGVPEKSIYSYENFDSIKDNADVEAVYVVLPNSMHAEYTIRAAKAGKHVICEKPMAIFPKECEEMIAACKQANRKLMIGYRLRYEPTHMKAIEICRNKTYGAPLVVESAHAFAIGQNEWRTDKTLAGGGPVMDVGIYSVNAARYLIGEEPASVSAQTWQPKDDPRFKTTEAQMAWTMKFPGGALMSGTTSYAHHSMGFVKLACESATIDLEPAFGYGGLKMRIRPRGGPDEMVEVPQINQFAAEMDHFAECILNDKTPRTPGKEGLADVKVLRKLYESAETGRIVEV